MILEKMKEISAWFMRGHMPQRLSEHLEAIIEIEANLPEAVTIRGLLAGEMDFHRLIRISN